MDIVKRIAGAFAKPRQNAEMSAQLEPLPVTQRSEGVLRIKAPDPTGENRLQHDLQAKGLKMARQEDWDGLADQIAAADLSHALTPGGMSIAELLISGARSDVVAAVEHALSDGQTGDVLALRAGITALEDIWAENPDAYAIGVIVARAHMDIAWAWRDAEQDPEIADTSRRTATSHLARASEILDRLILQTSGSSAIWSARCLLAKRAGHSEDILARHYETLIDLNPADARHLRSFGTALLPRWCGTYSRLDVEARRTAARHQDLWGAGGYTWVMMDAIAQDPIACAHLDTAFFIDGMRDILASQTGQTCANLFAAYCAVTLCAPTGDPVADPVRAELHACQDWIIREFLTELHPMIWAQAAHGFDQGLRVRCLDRAAEGGMNEAQRVLMGIFQPQLSLGKTITFTKDGLVTRFC